MSFSGDRIPSGTGTGTVKFFGSQFPSGAGTEISAENRSGPLNLSGNGTYSGSRTLTGTGACSYPPNLPGNGDLLRFPVPLGERDLLCERERFFYWTGTTQRVKTRSRRSQFLSLGAGVHFTDPISKESSST